MVVVFRETSDGMRIDLIFFLSTISNDYSAFYEHIIIKYIK